MTPESVIPSDAWSWLDSLPGVSRLLSNLPTLLGGRSLPPGLSSGTPGNSTKAGLLSGLNLLNPVPVLPPQTGQEMTTEPTAVQSTVSSALADVTPHGSSNPTRWPSAPRPSSGPVPVAYTASGSTSSSADPRGRRRRPGTNQGRSGAGRDGVVPAWQSSRPHPPTGCGRTSTWYRTMSRTLRLPHRTSGRCRPRLERLESRLALSASSDAAVVDGGRLPRHRVGVEHDPPAQPGPYLTTVATDPASGRPVGRSDGRHRDLRPADRRLTSLVRRRDPGPAGQFLGRPVRRRDAPTESVDASGTQFTLTLPQPLAPGDYRLVLPSDVVPPWGPTVGPSPTPRSTTSSPRSP